MSRSSSLCTIRRTRRCGGGKPARQASIGQEGSRPYLTKHDVVDFNGFETSHPQSDPHYDLDHSPLYPGIDPALSDQARSVTSTWQSANSDGDPNSWNPNPRSFESDNFDFDSQFTPLDIDPYLPEFAENLTQLTIDPSTLGSSNTPGTGFEDGQLQQILAGTRPPQLTSSLSQDHLNNTPSQNSFAPSQSTSGLGTTHQDSHIQRISSGPSSILATRSFALIRPSNSTTSSNSSTSNLGRHNNLLPVQATSSDPSSQVISQSNSRRNARRRVRPRRHLCTWPGCQRAFSSPKDLSRHQNTHTRVRTYQCPNSGCNKSFSRADNCQRHSRGDCPRRGS